MEYRQLFGYSGARLMMVSDRNGISVRKYSSTAGQDERLRVQACRQREIGSDSRCPFIVPKILREGIEAGRFYFDMEYVAGVGSPSFLSSAGIPKLKSYSHQLVTALTYLGGRRIPDDGYGDQVAGNLTAKIEEVFQKNCGLDEDVANRLQRRIQEVGRHGRSIFGTRTLFHGDLSLENIMVTSDGQIAFIDFLDGHPQHISQDLAKLALDLGAHWYARRHARIAEWVMRYLEDAIEEFAETSLPQFSVVRELLIAVNWVRILPYARTTEDRQFIVNNIRFQARNM